MRSSPKRYPNGQIRWHSKWDQNLQFTPQRVTTRIPVNFNGNPPTLDWEQSLFFFRLSESNARARERRSRETRETRAAAREEKRVSFFVPLPSRAISHARGHLRVSRFARRTTEKRETARGLSHLASKFKGANSITCSLRASSPIWASKASLARTRERGAV